MTELIPPYGNQLVDLRLSGEELAKAMKTAETSAKLTLSDMALCDIELLANGAFSPLKSFMGKEEYESVVNEMRLPDGTLWPLPVTLDVPEDFEIPEDGNLSLIDNTGVIVALMNVTEVFDADLDAEKRHIYGDNDEHPTLVRLRSAGTKRAAGPLKVIQMPKHPDFRKLRRDPQEVRQLFQDRGWSSIVAFQTRNPLHRAHEELVRRAQDEHADGALIHPVVGVTKAGDVDHFTRVRCYQKALGGFDENKTALSLLPLAMRMAGPREAVFHAIIRRNYGCNRLIVGRDHAGPGSDSNDKPFYGPYDAQDLLRGHEEEIGVKMVEFKMFVYVKDRDEYMPLESVPEGETTENISGTQVKRDYLAKGTPLPEWFTRADVAELLGEAYPPKTKQGVTIWLTGLSQSGKSTIANILSQRLLEFGRGSTLLDGDVVRTNLSKGLGFSKEDRDTNIRRIGYVAAEITRHGGTVITAAISPYTNIRQENREMIGNYVEVYVNAPIEICEKRDQKGNYKKAREGIIKGFTGVDDPYEAPEADFLEVRTDLETADESADKVLVRLRELGYI